MLSDMAENPKILHDDTVKPRLIKRCQILVKGRHLPLFQKRIYCQINFLSIKMGNTERTDNFLRREIVRICSGAKLLSAQIYRIRPGIYRTQKALITSRRGKQLNPLTHTVCSAS